MCKQVPYENKPYIVVKDDDILHISAEFLKLSGYDEEPLQGIRFTDLLALLRCSADSDLWQNECSFSCYMFTKSVDAKEIEVSIYHKENCERIITLQEIENEMFTIKYPFVEQLNSSNGYGVAVFSVPEFIMLKANDNYFRQIGRPLYKRERVLGQKREKWKGSWLHQLWCSVVEEGKPFHSKEFHAEDWSNEVRYWDYTLTPIFEKGVVKYVVLTVADMTESIENRDNLNESNELQNKQNQQMRVILESITDALLTVDKDLKITMHNKAAQRLLYSLGIEEEAPGSPDRAKYYNIDGKELQVFELPVFNILSGQDMNFFRVVIEKSGKTMYYNISGSPLYDKNGNVEKALICCRNITEAVLYDEMLKEQQRLQIESEKNEKKNLEEIIRLKDEFLYIMSHEFKTPLTVINSAIQVLEFIYKQQIPEKAFDIIMKIKQNTFRQLRLVNNILDITKINAGQMKAKRTNQDIVLLTKSITESVNIYSTQKGVDIIFDTFLESMKIGIDEEKFERIMLNILSNAIKFTPAGKTVYVRVNTADAEERQWICIQVQDEGVGIPKDKADLIFERFGQVDSSLTRQAEGTGIGLYLVKLLVGELGGRIELSSQVGEGSMFSIYLPCELSESNDEQGAEFMQSGDNRLIKSIAIEFSDIYL